MTQPVTILFFAWLRERAGTARETLTLPEGVTTLGQLIDLLRLRAGIAEAFATPHLVRAAVNQVFANLDTPVAPGDEIAFFPPVTGG
jgi:molybdopterin synthase sulfur carrier subunit